jgi:hypothetical protein
MMQATIATRPAVLQRKASWPAPFRNFLFQEKKSLFDISYVIYLQNKHEKNKIEEAQYKKFLTPWS